MMVCGPRVKKQRDEEKLERQLCEISLTVSGNADLVASLRGG